MFAKYKSVIYESLMVILGCAIFGAGLDAFVLPHKLVSTGISGVGLILLHSLYANIMDFKWGPLIVP